MEQNQTPVNEARVEPGRNDANTVPWSIVDTWIGVGLLILFSIGMLTMIYLGYGAQYMDNVGVIFLELIYILPVALIFAVRGIHWRQLGFGAFSLKTLAVGFGLLIAGYAVILAHNAILYYFGLSPQGEQIFDVLSQLDAPIWFFITGAVIAPFVEEIFFRGFLLQGFRMKYGGVTGILLSSFIFAAAHLDPVAFIPTFVLGCVLAYMYHRSNSLWPGIIFHAAINSFSLCAVYVVSQFPGLIPS
jgi:membrane protease YdiL (CAAX protease family)